MIVRLSESYRQKGIQATFYVAYTPHQNGTVERANRTINEGVRALLLGRDLGKGSKGTTVCEKPLPKIQSQGKCPYEVFTRQAKPLLPEFLFGQDVIYWQPRVKREKQDPPGQRGRYLSSAMSQIALSMPGAHCI